MTNEAPPDSHRLPRWVLVLAAATAIVVVVVLVVMLTGGGEHGPGRHGPQHASLPASAGV